MPLKRTVLGLLDSVSPVVEATGAANTVLLGDGLRIGDNTDVPGAVAARPGAVRRPAPQRRRGRWRRHRRLDAGCPGRARLSRRSRCWSAIAVVPSGPAQVAVRTGCPGGDARRPASGEPLEADLVISTIPAAAQTPDAARAPGGGSRWSSRSSTTAGRPRWPPSRPDRRPGAGLRPRPAGAPGGAAGRADGRRRRGAPACAALRGDARGGRAGPSARRAAPMPRVSRRVGHAGLRAGLRRAGRARRGVVPRLVAVVPEPEHETDPDPRHRHRPSERPERLDRPGRGEGAVRRHRERRPGWRLRSALVAAVVGALIGLSVGWAWPLVYLRPGGAAGGRARR